MWLCRIPEVIYITTEENTFYPVDSEMYDWLINQWRKEVLGAVVVVLCSLITACMKEPPKHFEACG